MNITKNDLFYILMSIVVTSIGVLAVSNVNNKIGIYGLLGLLAIAAIMAIIIKPSLGADILVVAVLTNISDLLTQHSFPGIMKPLVVTVAFALLVRYVYVGQVPMGHSKTARIEFFLLAYFMVKAMSFLVASNKSAALTEILDMAKDIVIIYCIMLALRQPQAWKRTVWLIIVTTALLSTLSVYQLLTHNYAQTFFGLASAPMDQVFNETFTARVGGPLNAPNLWAQVLVAVSTLLVFRIIHEKRLLIRLGGLLMLGLIWYATLNTYSRGAYVVLAIDLVLILFVFQKGFNPVYAFAGLSMLILIVPFLPASYLDRLSTLSFFTSQNGIYQDSSLRGRSSEMLTGLAMFAEHPILGVGTSNYETNYQQYSQLIGIEFRTEAREPHSIYVQVLAETGILGAIAFLGMIFSLFDALNKACRATERSPYRHDWLPWLNSFRVAILSYLLTSTFLHDAYIRYFWILVAMALAAIQITDALLNNSDRRTVLEVRR